MSYTAVIVLPRIIDSSLSLYVLLVRSHNQPPSEAHSVGNFVLASLMWTSKSPGGFAPIGPLFLGPADGVVSLLHGGGIKPQ